MNWGLVGPLICDSERAGRRTPRNRSGVLNVYWADTRASRCETDSAANGRFELFLVSFLISVGEIPPERQIWRESSESFLEPGRSIA